MQKSKHTKIYKKASITKNNNKYTITKECKRKTQIRNYRKYRIHKYKRATNTQKQGNTKQKQ